MGNLLKISFWFNTRPGMYSTFFAYGFGLLILVIILAYIIISLAVYYKKVNNTKFLMKIRTALGFNLVTTSLLLFFAYENIYLFSARVWFLVLLIIDILLVLNIVKDFKKVIERSDERKKIDELKKYIPR